MQVSGEAAAAWNAVRMDSMETVNKGKLAAADEATGAVSWYDKTGTVQTVTVGPHLLKLIGANR